MEEPVLPLLFPLPPPQAAKAAAADAANTHRLNLMPISFVV
jgi:hypothetical protein